ncbi:MAG: T9SS type A sorting domain-containing protein [Saprospiraceae bacterium]|nr:T9SS type A sorting domain-containing protein [Saprospiraceae bacterium]
MGKHLLFLIFFVCVFLGSQDTLKAQSSVLGSNNAAEISLVDIKVFPNPTTDFFQISNSLNIKKVVVYNMFGKEVKSFFHYNNAQHDVNDLKTGMYIVKMMDERNKVIKSVKLNKNYSGV